MVQWEDDDGYLYYYNKGTVPASNDGNVHTYTHISHTFLRCASTIHGDSDRGESLGRASRALCRKTSIPQTQLEWHRQGRCGADCTAWRVYEVGESQRCYCSTGGMGKASAHYRRKLPVSGPYNGGTCVYRR